MLRWLLLLTAATAAFGDESCHNYPTRIWPERFRSGDWIDQVRIYPGEGDYVSSLHAGDTVSMFQTVFATNCGYYELKALSREAFVLYKGYYASRFEEHFYPFKAVIRRNYSSLNCVMMLERSVCKSYTKLRQTSHGIDILLTDYESFMIIHQCVNHRSIIMALTKTKSYSARDKTRIERVLIDVMKDYGIVIENQTFVWSTSDFCDRHIGKIYPIFYGKVYFDPFQTECPENLPVDLTDLKDYWKDKTEHEEFMRERTITILICVAAFLTSLVGIVGSFMIFLDNFDMSELKIDY